MSSFQNKTHTTSLRGSYLALTSLFDQVFLRDYVELDGAKKKLDRHPRMASPRQPAIR